MNKINFYNEIIYSRKPIELIFNELPEELTEREFKKLSGFIHARLKREFGKYKEGESNDDLIGMYRMPDDKMKRLRVAMLMIDACRYGTPYSLELYKRTLDYFIRKDLMPKRISLN